MFRPASRSILRAAAAQSSLAPARTSVPRRFASSATANSRRSWKNSALRWGIAIGGLYYYNTSPVFAEQPSNNLLNPNLDALDEDHETSLEALTSRRKPQSQNAAALHSAADSLSSENASTTLVDESEQLLPTDTSGDVADLEQEADSQGAFNPETGEINWDCPCLGGMAHGPCGPEFREAFSCFVFSTQEPKGMDCIDKFQGMQQCFQRHPEVYKGELEDDEELDAELEGERQKLVDEIAERKAQQADQGAAPARRLLEEPAPEATPVKSAKKTKSKKRTKSADQPASEAKTSIGDKKLSEFTADNELQNEGSKSSNVHDPKPPSVEEAAIPESDLVPRATHDARDNVGVADVPKTEK